MQTSTSQRSRRRRSTRKKPQERRDARGGGGPRCCRPPKRAAPLALRPEISVGSKRRSNEKFSSSSPSAARPLSHRPPRARRRRRRWGWRRRGGPTRAVIAASAAGADVRARGLLARLASLLAPPDAHASGGAGRIALRSWGLLAGDGRLAKVLARGADAALPTGPGLAPASLVARRDRAWPPVAGPAARALSLVLRSALALAVSLDPDGAARSAVEAEAAAVAEASGLALAPSATPPSRLRQSLDAVATPSSPLVDSLRLLVARAVSKSCAGRRSHAATPPSPRTLPPPTPTSLPSQIPPSGSSAACRCRPWT